MAQPPDPERRGPRRGWGGGCGGGARGFWPGLEERQDSVLGHPPGEPRSRNPGDVEIVLRSHLADQRAGLGAEALLEGAGSLNGWTAGRLDGWWHRSND